MGDVINFIDIYGNQDMIIFHPWAIIIIQKRWGLPRWWFKITILHDNIFLNNYDNVINLIEKEGADPWKKTGTEDNCLDIAINKNHHKLIDYFQKNYPSMCSK
jgi:hypothetical protein